ncbi:MAG: hypothetical protein ACI9MR_001703 [Myxococcota bacterium]
MNHRRHRWCIIAAAVIAVVLPGLEAHSRPTAPAHPRHVVALHLGLPFPAQVYGSGIGGEDTGVEIGWLGYANLGYAVGLSSELPVYVGVWVDAANVQTCFEALCADTYFVALGVELRWSFAFDGGLGPALDVGVGPAVLWSGVIVDPYIQLHTTSWGARAQLTATYPINRRFRLSLQGAFRVFGAPTNKTTWFNEPLGGSSLASVALGIALTL